MITTPFLKASTAPPPYSKPQRRVGTGFGTHNRPPFGVKCLHCNPGLPLRARATDGTTHFCFLIAIVYLVLVFIPLIELIC
jgi:hypothetical protein